MITNRSRIRFKLSASFFLLIFILVTAFIAFSYFHTRNIMLAETHQRGADVSLSFAQMVKTGMLEMDYVVILESARELVENSDILSVSVLDRNGGMIINTGSNGAVSVEEPFYGNTFSKDIVRQRIIERDRMEILESVRLVTTRNRVAYLLCIEMPLNGTNVKLAQSRDWTWAIAGLGSLLALLLAAFLTKKITDPLRKLVEGAQEISKGNVNRTIDIQTDDETGVLADCFNEITANLVQERTQRERSETGLHNSQKIFDTVMNSIEALVYVSDLETHEILYMNKNMQDLFGGDRTGEQCWSVLRNGYERCEICPVDKLVGTDNRPAGVHVWEGENPLTGRWYRNCDMALKWTDGRLVRLQVATDITNRKKMEKERVHMEYELRQSQKLKTIGTLAGGIVHDLNNILSPIIGFTEMAIDDAKGNPLIKRSLEEILIAGKRAKALVQQILAFSRQHVNERKPIRVQSVVGETLQLLRSSLPATIRFQEKIDPDCGPIMGDSTQIHQVMMNLGTNAYHAMEANGGILTVAVQEVDIVAEDDMQKFKVPKGRYLRLAVSDTGAGMSPAVVARIFDPYFTTKEEGRGTGIGLSVVHGIVKGSNGSIYVSSEVGRGTTVAIIFPLVSKRHLFVTKEREGMDTPQGKGSILVVDDEEQIVRMVKNMLERVQYSVSGSTSSLEALELFRKQPDRFDLVITDLIMPNMTGEVLAKEILRIRPQLPIILITGFGDKISAIKTGESGITKILLKPIIKDDLWQVVQEALAQSAHLAI